MHYHLKDNVCYLFYLWYHKLHILKQVVRTLAEKCSTFIESCTNPAASAILDVDKPILLATSDEVPIKLVAVPVAKSLKIG